MENANELNETFEVEIDGKYYPFDSFEVEIDGKFYPLNSDVVYEEVMKGVREIEEGKGIPAKEVFNELFAELKEKYGI